MELQDFIKTELDSIKQITMKAMDGLSQEELKWKPNHEANSIGLIYFHQSRSEDRFVQSRILGKDQIWESEKWYLKLDKKAEDSGGGYTNEQLAMFVVPKVKDLLEYSEAVRSKTLECLKNMTLAEFDKVINIPRLGDKSLGAIFSLVVLHLAQHAGEISYLRGLQRGMNK